MESNVISEEKYLHVLERLLGEATFFIKLDVGYSIALGFIGVQFFPERNSLLQFFSTFDEIIAGLITLVLIDAIIRVHIASEWLKQTINPSSPSKNRERLVLATVFVQPFLHIAFVTGSSSYFFGFADGYMAVPL